MPSAVRIRSVLSAIGQLFDHSASPGENDRPLPAQPRHPALSRYHGGIAPLVFRFKKASGANIAVTFSLALLPILTGIGCAVDFSSATMARAKLQSAADAASVAAVAVAAPGFIAASKMSGDGEIPDGEADALTVFKGNIPKNTVLTAVKPTAVVTKAGVRVNSSVDVTANLPLVMMSIFGIKDLKLTIHSSASNELPVYRDFYMMLDVSASMGLPSTAKGQQKLASISPDEYSKYPTGCVFACHWARPDLNVCGDSVQKYPTNNYCQGYPLSRNGGNPSNTPVTACLTPDSSACIQLRADAVGAAVTDLVQNATDWSTVPDQFRIGLYPFIQKLDPNYFPLTKTLTGSVNQSGTIASAAAKLASLLDDGQNATLGSGGTHISGKDGALQTMNGLISSVGSGASWSDPLPVVVLITDGAQDNQVQWNTKWTGSNHATTVTQSDCDAITKRGITLAVLYIPYIKIDPASPTFAGGEDIYANDNIPFISPALEKCASPGYFYTTNSPQEISDALVKILKQPVKAHIMN